ncbi:MAG: hypothetical protein KGJ98_14205, partial [Chloroflexota bacterium]|nr:hypothetical protein [Chloroflexota bacterium]
MSLGDKLLAIAKQHMGLAASAYITAELRAIGRSRAELDVEGLREIARRALTSTNRFMDPEAVDAFATEVEALAAAAGDGVPTDTGVDHKLALDAANALLARGDTHRALLAFTQLAERHGDVESFRGLARAAAVSGETAAAVGTLREGALRVVQRGARDEAISLLEEAVTLAPVDLAIHRRLVAVYANAGDATSAKCEHARFVDACLDVGDVERARGELDYARQTVGDSSALRELEHRVATGAPKRVLPRPAIVVASVKPAAATAVAPTPPVASAPVGVPIARPAPPLVDSLPPPARVTAVTPTMSTAEERAVIYLGQRDPRAAAECLAAARELIETHKDLAAADLLIAHVASGLRDRDVQRLLITVDRALGRSDIAVEKAQLLARILELDGDPIGARDVQ